MKRTVNFRTGTLFFTEIIRTDVLSLKDLRVIIYRGYSLYSLASIIDPFQNGVRTKTALITSIVKGSV